MNMCITKRLCMVGAVVFSLATGAGSAFAQETCEERIINDTTIDGDITVVGDDCYLQNVTVYGDVTVLNAGKFTIQNSRVIGNITVEASGDVTINDTNATGYDVIATGNERVDVTFSMAAQFAVTRNGLAYVIANAATTYECRDNIRLVADKNEGPNARHQCDTLRGL